MSNNYKNVEDSINSILENLQLKDDERKKYNSYLHKIIDFLMEQMMKQPVFKGLFQGIQHVGSTYENLKIETPDEFDINFELKIPQYAGSLQVVHSPDAGFCRLLLYKPQIYQPQLFLLSGESGYDQVSREMRKWTDVNGCLRISEVMNWMRSVVDTACKGYKNLSVGNEQFEVRRSYSGPAVSLNVKHLSKRDVEFSIDLVPVFVFDTWPTNIPNQRPWEPRMGTKKWYAVPKSRNADTNFRMSFWHIEKQLLSNKNQLKPILKMMKKLRDANDWKIFSSYYIKSIFLWKNDSVDQNYWDSSSKSEVFVDMLREMEKYLLQRTLPFYWNNRCDLLYELTPETKQNFGHNIQNMIADIKTNLNKKNYIEKYFE